MKPHSFLLRIATLLAWCHVGYSIRSPEEIRERLAARGDGAEEVGRQRRQLPTEINIQVTAPLFSSRLFDFGTEEGDQEVPTSVDVGKRLSLTRPIRLYNKDYTTVYILSNGAIGFTASARSYRANIFPSEHTLIAPYWNRNDMRKGGHVYYREILDGRVLERGGSEIRYQYDKAAKPKSALLVTWVGMQPLGDQTLSEDNTNTFQAAIFSTDNGTYANFIYKNIGWTQGAQAGFNAGDNDRYYALPTSNTSNIMYLEEYGNTGIPGEWMFQLDMNRIARCKPGTKGDTCDEKCEAHEWGYDCAGCCHCSGGKCDLLTGACKSGTCGDCWTGFPTCQTREQNCKARSSKQCAHNAISFTDYDRCGEPVLRCQCLAGYTGDGKTLCEDIDECAANPCHENARCVNTPGRYYCECLEGYTGDGTLQCTASFFYPNEEHQELPRERGSKVTWQFRQPLQIFGRQRDALTILSNGLISLEKGNSLRFDDPLEDVGLGFVPFFGRIDLSQGGRVTVDETTDSGVLTKATRSVAEGMGDEDFLASSVLSVTFQDVTTPQQQGKNSFQANIIGGEGRDGRQKTFVEYLYKDLEWSEGAQAGILTDNVQTSLDLPGSGSQGIVQLARLSNVQKPGQWIFQVDGTAVEPCPSNSLQPPYCDTELPPESRRPPATQPPRARPQPRPTPRPNPQPREETVTFRPFITVIPNLITPSRVNVNIPRPRPASPGRGGLIIPTRNRGENNGFGRQPSPNQPRTNGPRRPPSSGTRVTPPPGLNPAQTSDPFAPPAGPSSFVPRPRTNAPDQGQVFIAPPSAATDRPPVFPPPILQTTRPLPPIFKTRPPIVTAPPIQPQPTWPPFSQTIIPHTAPPPPARTFAPPVFVTRTPPSIGFTRINSPDRTNPPNIFTRPPPIDGNDIDSENFVPLEIFTTPRRAPRPRVPTKRPSIVTGTTRRPRINLDTNRIGGNLDRNRGEATPEEDLNSPSKLAIIIPTAIVGVWLLLLLVIGLVVCCRRRKSRKKLRSKYDPSYHFRQYPMGHPPHSRPKKERGGGVNGYPSVHASYEDHLEKAARLSEMSQYSSQNNNRVSLYGSYWNMQNGNANEPGGSRQPHGHSSGYKYYNQGYYDSCPEFSRYPYGGRY